MATYAPAPSGRIFISYRRQETAYPAGWLYDRLAARFGEDQVFKDVDSIAPGDDFIEVITSAVGSCDVLLAVIGNHWLTITDEDGRRRLDNPNDFVRLEIESALQRNVRVIPILVDGASMPRTSDLPSSLTALVRRQALELSPNQFSFDTSRLLKVLLKTLAEARTAPKDPPAISTSATDPDGANKPALSEDHGHRRAGTPTQQLDRPGPAGQATGDQTPSKPPTPRRRRSTRAWSLAGLGIGILLIPLLIVAAVATNSKPTTPTTHPPVQPKPPNAPIASLNDLVADFRKLGFTPTSKNQEFDLGSLPNYYDETHRQYLRELDLRRAAASFFESPANGYSLEVRIFEFRSPAQAHKGQDLLSICRARPTTSINTKPIADSKGTQCVVREGFINEVAFTRGARLYKLKLLRQSHLPSTKTLIRLARAEAAVAQ
jgi:hypothetical protein